MFKNNCSVDHVIILITKYNDSIPNIKLTRLTNYKNKTKEKTSDTVPVYKIKAKKKKNNVAYDLYK